MQGRHLGLLLLAAAVAASGWSWFERRGGVQRAVAYAARTYPGARVEVRNPRHGRECGVVLMQVDGHRWVLFDSRRGREAVAVDEDGVGRLVREQLGLPETVPVRVVDTRNTAGTGGLFVAGVAVGEGIRPSRWELGVDVQGCRLMAVELAQRDPFTGEVVRHRLMQALAPPPGP